ncbi:thioesterase family protein [uncultured Lutibacter sp.]|uniref:acyl-CoA thioesterase n=1 Tax=uncultured Lutibacter sp. TaxID=437739 RepID=UPI00260DD9C5|nr:thioesterase family protein [uncultured Lutibacter sp.]
MENFNRFTFTLIVTNNELDDLNHVNNIHYIKWVQEAAQKHWKILSNTNLDTKYVWVVLRHEIDYIASAILHDIITVNTWIVKSYGVKSERFVEIKKGSKTIAKAKTIWCLLDKTTMKPARIPSEILEILETKKE